MKIVFMFLIAALNVSIAFAQDEYHKIEGGVNFLHQRISDTGGFDDSVALNGFDVSLTKSLTRLVGIKGAFSGGFKKDDFSIPGFAPNTTLNFSFKTSVYTYMAGIQVKDNTKEKRFKPFFHALAGGATFRQTLSGDCPSDVQAACSDFSFSSTGFSAAVGGGLDVRATRRLSIRVVQADYNPIFVNDTTLSNFRIGVGLVFH
jgi:opacity protein-like surface antigen